MCFSQYEQRKGPGVKLFQWFTLLRSVNVVDDGAVANIVYYTGPWPYLSGK